MRLYALAFVQVARRRSESAAGLAASIRCCLQDTDLC